MKLEIHLDVSYPAAVGVGRARIVRARSGDREVTFENPIEWLWDPRMPLDERGRLLKEGMKDDIGEAVVKLMDVLGLVPNP